MKILLIEDNPGDARLVREMLSETPGDFTINVAEKLGLGIEFLLSQDVDVVLLDMGLPDSCGLETLIKLQTQFSNVPIVIMTGSGDESLGVQAVQLGAQDYMVKGQVDGKLLQRALLYATERKKADETLHRQAALLDISSDAVFSWEIGRGILSRNRGAQEIYGFSAADAIGHNPHVLLQTIGIDVHQFDEKLQHDGRWEGELTHTKRNGRKITVDTRMVVLYQSGQHQKTVVLETNRDITERKKAEQIKDEFISMVSHELRTPLTVIMGALYTVRDERVPSEDKRELLNDATEGAKELAGIVENLLELSRYQANRLTLQQETTDIGDIVRNIIQKLQSKSDVHRLSMALPTGLPPVSIDRIRMERILYNLVENAIKYSPDGGEVKTSITQQDDHLVVAVSDHGIGITREDQSKLFQSFQRLETKPSVKGTGLGLRVCQILVRAHGGRIWVESEQGKGSTFFFTLPVAKNSKPAV